MLARWMPRRMTHGRGERWLGRLAASTAAFACLAAISAAGAAANPGNDSYDDAADLGHGAVVSATGDNHGASKEADEEDHAGDSGGASVWYRWTAVASGTAMIDTCGSDFDTLLAVYSDSGSAGVGHLHREAANDDACGATGEQSLLSVSVTAGSNYRIAVDGKNGSEGTIDLSLALGGSSSTRPVPVAMGWALSAASAKGCGKRYKRKHGRCVKRHKKK